MADARLAVVKLRPSALQRAGIKLRKMAHELDVMREGLWQSDAQLVGGLDSALGRIANEDDWLDGLPMEPPLDLEEDE